jgi:hypothetical protein
MNAHPKKKGFKLASLASLASLNSKVGDASDASDGKKQTFFFSKKKI